MRYNFTKVFHNVYVFVSSITQFLLYNNLETKIYVFFCSSWFVYC